MIVDGDHRPSPEMFVTKIRCHNCPSLIEMYSEPWMTLSQNLLGSRTHYFTEKIICNSGHTARTRDPYHIVIPLFVMALTPRRFHSSRISFVPKRVRDCSSRGTGFEEEKKLTEKNKEKKRRREIFEISNVPLLRNKVRATFSFSNSRGQRDLRDLS